MKFTFKASWISISLLVKKSEIRIPFLRKIFKAFCCFWIIFFDKRIDIWRLYDWKVLFEVCIRAFWDCTRLRFVLLSVYFILVIVLTLILSWNLINWIKKLALRLDNLGWEHPWTRFWLKRSDWGYSQIGLLQNNGLLLVGEHGRHNGYSVEATHQPVPGNQATFSASREPSSTRGNTEVGPGSWFCG